jgi:ubiquinone/menaquinone biosynthesis C-methylase UbiE
MQSEEYDRMYQLEETYWWFVGRHHLVLTFLNRLYPGRKDLRILDVGCGTGAMSQKLEQFGDVVSADASPLALAYASKRGLNRLCESDACRLPFREKSFDLIVALDLLEHVKDDAAALAEFQRVLKPGGRVIITVPAYKGLWSGHDVALMHYRRYVAREVRERFEGAGLKVKRLSYAMTALYPVVWLFRKLERMKKSANPKAHLVQVTPGLNRMLVGLLAAENTLIGKTNLPYGVTVFCMAQRPEGVSNP